MELLGPTMNENFPDRVYEKAYCAHVLRLGKHRVQKTRLVFETFATRKYLK